MNNDSANKYFRCKSLYLQRLEGFTNKTMGIDSLSVIITILTQKLIFWHIVGLLFT